jgi:hypothetical protein
MEDGCGCVIVVVIGLMLAGACHECSEDSSGSTQQEEQVSEVEQLRQTFFSNEGHEIRSALNELEAIEAEWITRKEKLAAICHIIDRRPHLDQDYQLWTERLNQLETDRQKLNNMAGDAFLAYAKFQLALDPISEELYQRALKEGLIVAAELRRQYQMLKELKVSSGSR